MPLCPAAKIQPESRHTTWHIVVTLSWCIMMCHDVVVGSGAWSVRHKRWLAPETGILKSNAQLEIWTPDRQWQVWQVTNPERDMSATATPFFDQMLDFLTVCWLKWGSKHQANHTHSKSTKKHFDIKMSIKKNTKNQGGICKDVFVPTLQYIAMFGMLGVLMEPLISVAECCE